MLYFELSFLGLLRNSVYISVTLGLPSALIYLDMSLFFNKKFPSVQVFEVCRNVHVFDCYFMKIFKDILMLLKCKGCV